MKQKGDDSQDQVHDPQRDCHHYEEEDRCGPGFFFRKWYRYETPRISRNNLGKQSQAGCIHTIKAQMAAGAAGKIQPWRKKKTEMQQAYPLVSSNVAIGNPLEIWV